MAERADIYVDQGTTFTTSVIITDANNALLDLTGYSANAVFKKHYASNTNVVISTSINVTTSTITLTLNANQTSAINAGRYVYDINIQTGNTVTRVFEGILTITPGVTGV